MPPAPSPPAPSVAQPAPGPAAARALHFSLLGQLIWRQIELRHRGSALGWGWSLLSPLALLVVYTVVFGYIFGGSFGAIPGETKADYALGIFLGLAIFNLVGEVLAVAPLTIVGNPNFVKKIVFPVALLPVACVGAALFHFAISLVLVIAGAVVLGQGLAWSLLWLAVLLPPVVMLCVGLSWAMAGLGVFLRDLPQLLQLLSACLMFASAVFYPITRVPPALWEWLQWNPLIHAIETARAAVLWHTPVELGSLGYLWLAGAGSLLTGWALFSALRRTFADVL